MADHRKRRNKQFRREISKKISDIQDKYCSPCEIKDCKNCDHDRTLKHYGNLLLQDSQDRRNKKEQTKIKKEERRVKTEETNGLTKDKYKMLKKEGKTDREISQAYKLHGYKLSALKEKWGLLGYRSPNNKLPETEKVNEIKVEKERYEEKQKAQLEERPVKDTSEKLTETVPEAKELANQIKALQEEKEHLWKENKEQSLRIGRLLNENAALHERIETLEEDLANVEGQNRYKELYLSHAAALRAHLMDV
jgi:chromosome segregation ATPase